MNGKRAGAEDLPAPAAKRHAGQSLDDLFGLPGGWRECPRYSVLPFPGLEMVASKVPLSGDKWDKIISEQDAFTPKMLLSQLQEQNIHIGMVIDLTNSDKYYWFDDQGASEFQYDTDTVFHRKIKCRGHGQAPDPSAVNDFCWELSTFAQHQQSSRETALKEGYPEPQKAYVLVHCTHGFNRTGYMIVNAMMRLMGKTCASALRSFQQCRPPGIYKRHYIQDLFKYHHEKTPSGFTWPRLPHWKALDEEDLPHSAATAPEEAIGHMQHDDVIGEEVSEAEAQAVQAQIMFGILGPQALDSELRFPGSQPVSLAASNMHLLAKHRYRVTWKADGTRYMLYLSPMGTYLVDRSFSVRRVQMRWPTAAPHTSLKYDPAKPHHSTLLDGEMVVDEDKVTKTQKRRYLAYDMMMLNGQALRRREFKERYAMLESDVMKPRGLERDAMLKDLSKPAQHRRMPAHYLYQEEAFSARRKEFWPLLEAKSLLDHFIPTRVCHESDGLILQPYVGPKSEYIPHTCDEVLKWKFAHLNSVDFRLRLKGSGGEEGQEELLLLTRTGEQPVSGAKVIFPDDAGAQSHNNSIIECSWDAHRQAWSYMRERHDKATPNAWRVYEKVVQSIQDNITPATLLQTIKDAVSQSEVYNTDRQQQAAAVAQVAKKPGKQQPG